MIESGWDIEILDRPGLSQSVDENKALQAELCKLGILCLSPLPFYQVFETKSGRALDDKIIVTAKIDGVLVGFVSTISLPIHGIDKPVIHTGLTVVHPRQRKSGILQALFANLFFYLLAKYPDGVWCTTLSEIISSLVQMSLYTTQVFPSPQWLIEHVDGAPSPAHLAIAKEIDKKHREKLLISRKAIFEEKMFVFKSSNDSPEGKAFWNDVDNPIHWHRDLEQSRFYRSLLRRNEGDEVLQISFLDLNHLEHVRQTQRFKRRFDDLSAKVRATAWCLISRRA